MIYSSYNETTTKETKMPKHSVTDMWKKILQQRHGETLIFPDGSALVLLVGPELDDVAIITAPVGGSFNNMSDQEVNEAIVTALTM